MAVEDYSTTAGSNTSIGAISIAEGWSPADVNNALRQLMADIATWRDGAIADIGGAADYQPLDATLTALAGVTTAANKVIYATGADTFSTTDLTAFGRTLLSLASYSALRSGLGAVTVTASSLSNPGYFTLDIGGTSLIINWGTGSIAGNTSGTTVSYAQSYSSFSIPVVNGGNSNTGVEGNVTAYSAGLSSFTIKNSGGNPSATYYWIAIGI